MDIGQWVRRPVEATLGDFLTDSVATVREIKDLDRRVVRRQGLPGQDVHLVVDYEFAYDFLTQYGDHHEKSAIQKEILGGLGGDHEIAILDDDTWGELHPEILQIAQKWVLRDRFDEYNRIAAEAIEQYATRDRVVLDRAFPQVAFRMTAATVLDNHEDLPHEKISHLLRTGREYTSKEAIALTSVLPDFVPTRRRYYTTKLREQLHGEIRDLWEQEPDSVFGSMFGGEDAASVSTEQLTSLLFSILVPGTSGTALAARTAVYETVFQGYQDSVRAACGNSSGVSFSDVNSPPDLVENIVNEAIRLYPPIAEIRRMVTTPFEQDGYSFDAGATVVVPIYGIHRSEKYWTDPDQFRPERWDDTSPNTSEFIGFGVGKRRCTGELMSRHHIRTLLLNLFGRSTVEIVEPNEPIEWHTQEVLGKPKRQHVVSVTAT